MAAYRIGSHLIWQALLDIVEAHDEISRHALLAVTERIWEAQDVYTNAMTNSYRRRATQQAVDDEAERAALTEALFSGTVSAGHSPWEIADLLGLPTRGPYVVVAARTPELGKHALPGIVDKLRSSTSIPLGGLLPELQVGIVHLPSEAARAGLIATLRRMSSHGAGVSPRFNALSDIGTALRYARIAVTGTSEAEPVVEFEDSVLAIPRSTCAWPTRCLVAWTAWRIGTCCFRHFGCGGRIAVRYPRPRQHCSVIPTPFATGCAGLRNTPADRSAFRSSSPSCVWPSKSIPGVR